jgi:uncharacterized protein
MRRVFADTFYWTARFNPLDQWHQDVMDVANALGEIQAVTTDEVLVEFLASVSRFGPDSRREAAVIVRQFLNGANTLVLPQSRASFMSGLQLYESRLDKAYSLTDCISMCAMRHHGLSGILTNDAHFIQEGFNALFRSSPRR